MEYLSPGSATGVKALILNCTLKPSPARSNTEALAGIVGAKLAELGVEVDAIRAVDHRIRPGVSSDEGDGDEWPAILERMDAMLGEEDEEGRPVACNRVAGVIVTGNEDGAHHVISEVSGALGDIGFTIPGQAWTYWNRGPGPGDDYLDSDESNEWSRSTGEAAAANLHAVARALAEHPVPAPSG